MAIYLIGYDLNKEGKDYDGLIQEIKDNYGTWWHHLDSTWLVKTSDSASTIYNKLKPHLDKNDEMLVIEVTNNYSGCLKEKAWEWLRKHLPKDK